MELRYYQKEAVRAIFDYYNSGKHGNCVVALPTGTGKSLCIAEFIIQVLKQWPNQRFLMLTHVKELISQNADKLIKLWPNAPLGLFSAGLGESNSTLPIIFAGIASVNSNPALFGHRDIVLVDECHTISPNENSMYQKTIAALKVLNPYLIVVGFTATAFRLGQGMITDGGLFTDICYDCTSLHAFNRLIAEGFISPLIPKRPSIELNVDNVKISNGDFQKHELQKAVDIDSITYAAIKEFVEYGYDRHCGLIFGTGIDHCEHLCAAVQSFGETCTFIHSNLPTKERDKRLSDFKAGIYKYIVSNGILTTGFDHAPIDIIGCFRPTMSPGLWVQLLGRGTRPYTWLDQQQYIAGFNYVKENCLVLDFAGNTKRLGPINDPVKPRKKGQKTGDAPIRICDACGTYNHASARHCCSCGQEFEIRIKIFGEASSDELIKTDLPVVETFSVNRVIYHKYQKIGSLPMIRASYYSGLKMFTEYVCIEHSGYPGTKAKEWWNTRTQVPFPKSVDEALQTISNLKSPSKINVQTNCKFPRILNYEY